MPLDHFTRLCESYIEDCNKISLLDHFAHSCKKFTWLCQILKNSIANISICLISHHYAKIDPHAKTFHLFPTIFKIPYLRKIYSRSQDTKEVEDHLCLFLFHSHSLISLPCRRPHTSLGTLIFFFFLIFLRHSQHFGHSKYSIFHSSLSLKLQDEPRLKRKLRLGLRNCIFDFLLEVVAFFFIFLFLQIWDKLISSIWFIVQFINLSVVILVLFCYR